MKNKIELIRSELAASLATVDFAAASRLAEAVSETADRSGKIYCAAAGRMLFVAQSFVMRLNQMGIPANCCSDTYVPPIVPQDMILAVSSSGTTRGVVDFASRAASGPGAAVWMIGCNPRSPLAGIAEGIVLFRPAGSTRALDAAGKTDAVPSVQPMSSLNEQTVFLLLDAVVLALMEKRHITGGDMDARHFNVE